MKYDVAVIGCGRVGLPLLLAFADKGKKVAAVDISNDTLQWISFGKMPFDEPGCQEILDKYKIDTFFPDDIPEAEYYILTVGTPVSQHIETDLRAVKLAVMNLINKKVLNKDTTLILRSTVAPGTTEYVKNLLEIHNVQCNLAMCPERLAEGKAWEELHKLPQIVGSFDRESCDKATELFRCFGVWVYQVSPKEAELAKLFCNIYRYINFAIPNYFLYLMKEFEIEDCNRLFEVMTDNYPRMSGLPKAGLAAGTCLRKDFGMINECFPQTDLLLQAYKINEFMPKFLVNQAGNLKGKKVVILGYTFKRDTDDTRDSLVPKLLRYIERQNPESIRIVEPNLPEGTYIDKFNDDYKFNNEILKYVDADANTVVFVGTNHSIFERSNTVEALKKRAGQFIDIWNSTI